MRGSSALVNQGSRGWASLLRFFGLPLLALCLTHFPAHFDVCCDEVTAWLDLQEVLLDSLVLLQRLRKIYVGFRELFLLLCELLLEVRNRVHGGTLLGLQVSHRVLKRSLGRRFAVVGGLVLSLGLLRNELEHVHRAAAFLGLALVGTALVALGFPRLWRRRVFLPLQEHGALRVVDLDVEVAW